MRTALLVSLLLAGPVAAQSVPQSKQPDERKAASSEPKLNLRLDEADLRSLSRSGSGARVPAEEKSADTLPSLGGDARRFEQPTPSSDTRRPYPADTGQAHGR